VKALAPERGRAAWPSQWRRRQEKQCGPQCPLGLGFGTTGRGEAREEWGGEGGKEMRDPSKGPSDPKAKETGEF
jgi:hypothetical protein